MNEQQISECLKRNQIPCEPELPEQLECYFRLLNEWNRSMDLIAELPEEELLDRHFTDSLTVLKTGLLEDCETLIDVGTGAGFPGMVLALALPGLRVTLIDAQQKRLHFLQAVMEETGAGNITILHSRAEDGGRLPYLRDSFDRATARALAPLNVLCEYVLPFVRQGGKALFWKGPSLREELQAGKKAVHLLGGKMEDPIICPVAGRDWGHLILPIEKVTLTPGRYPRKAGIPKTRPL